MTNLFLQNQFNGKMPIALSMPIAEGAAGTIHRVNGQAGFVVKLYKEPGSLSEYSRKIAAMVASPPELPRFSVDEHDYVQIAWPMGPVVDGRGGFRGFVMPEVDIQASTELENILQKSMRQRKNLPEFYGARVLLAANLAALVSELHRAGHFMIDMKPTNLRFYPDSLSLAIIDCDGFSINGPSRIPARQFSDEYIAPEARGKAPDQLGLAQDLFALAVIVFRLLNNGIHPYQGVDPLQSTLPTTLQERIFLNLYTYGRVPHPVVGATPASIHEYLDDGTRELFDKAFSTEGKRPTADDWKVHLNSLIEQGVLVKCATDPTNHAHFGKGCGLCVQESGLNRAQGVIAAPVQLKASVLATLQSGKPGIRPSVVRRETRTGFRKRGFIYLSALTFGLLALFATGYFRKDIFDLFNHSAATFTAFMTRHDSATSDSGNRPRVLAVSVAPSRAATQQDMRALAESLQEARVALARAEEVRGTGGRRAPGTLLEEGRAALAWRDYAAAEQAARGVISSVGSPLVYDGNILLGQSLAGQRRFAQAVAVFDSTYNYSRSGVYAQDALLGLAKSLTAIDERAAACGVLEHMHSEFPEVRADLRETIATMDARLECAREGPGALVAYPWPRNAALSATPPPGAKPSESTVASPENGRLDHSDSEAVPRILRSLSSDARAPYRDEPG